MLDAGKEFKLKSAVINHRIVNWNVTKIGDSQDAKAKGDQIEKCLEQACRGADFVTLQEVEQGHDVSLTLMLQSYGFCALYHKTGLMVAYNKEKYQNTCFVFWSYSNSDESCICAEFIEKKTKALMIVCTTSLSPQNATGKRFADHEERRHQVEEMERFIGKITDEQDCDIIITGDFQTDAKSRGGWRLLDYNNAYPDCQFTTRKAAANGTGTVETVQDFIFSNGRTVAVLEPKDLGIDEETVLPNDQFPSAHVLMMADIIF